MVSSSTSSAVPLKLVWKAAAMFFLKFTTSVFSYLTFRADLWWWLTFASHWNGVVLFPPTTPAKFQVTSDASGWWRGVVRGFNRAGFSFSGLQVPNTTTLPSRSSWQWLWHAPFGVETGMGRNSVADAITRQPFKPSPLDLARTRA